MRAFSLERPHTTRLNSSSRRSMLCRGVLQNRMVLPVHWQTLLQGSSEPEDVSRRRRGCHVDDPPLHTLAGYRFQRGRLYTEKNKKRDLERTKAAEGEGHLHRQPPRRRVGQPLRRLGHGAGFACVKPVRLRRRARVEPAGRVFPQKGLERLDGPAHAARRVVAVRAPRMAAGPRNRGRRVR